EASRSDAEGPTVEVDVLGERPDRLEIAGGEFLGHEVGQAQAMGRPFDRSDRIDPKDLVIERGRLDLDPFRGKGRQGLRPREGRMFSGQFDERPHVRPTVAPRMSLPTTGILKSNGPFGRAGWRRRGFGRQIMDAFVQRCAMRGLRRIELEVRISNEEAIRFYKRYGFDIAAVLPKFYTDGEDGFKMVKHF